MRALLSVANREGISGFARELTRLGFELFATDGTREHLAADGVEAASVSELTAARRASGLRCRSCGITIDSKKSDSRLAKCLYIVRCRASTPKRNRSRTIDSTM